MQLKFILLAFLWLIVASCTPKYISWSDNDPLDNDENVKTKFIELPDIYEVSCDISLQEADLMLKSALEERNYKIVHVSHVTKGMKEQGRKDFWEDMNIYMICRLSDGYYVLKHNPWLVGMCPLRIFTYRNKEGRLVIGMFRPSLSSKWMGNLDMEALKTLKLYDKELKEAIDSVCNE